MAVKFALDAEILKLNKMVGLGRFFRVNLKEEELYCSPTKKEKGKAKDSNGQELSQGRGNRIDVRTVHLE